MWSHTSYPLLALFLTFQLYSLVKVYSYLHADITTHTHREKCIYTLHALLLRVKDSRLLLLCHPCLQGVGSGKEVGHKLFVVLVHHTSTRSGSKTRVCMSKDLKTQAVYHLIMARDISRLCSLGDLPAMAGSESKMTCANGSFQSC